MDNFQLNTFTIITKKNCKWCVLAKKVLKERKIPFKEITIPNFLTRDEFITLTEKYETKKTVPKIFLGKKLIGGYEDLVEYIEKNGENLDNG
mgnify:FL=1